MPDSSGIISRDELKQLADFFARYDGALDPLSADCQDAEYQFNALVEKLHIEKVRPVMQTISLSQFRCAVRQKCRLIVSKQGPSYPCINPEIALAVPISIDPIEDGKDP
jgi:hypothetical protein